MLLVFSIILVKVYQVWLRTNLIRHVNKNRGSTFYGFKNIMWLSINDCSLYGNLPKWLSKLKNLRALLLYNNQISGSIPAWINSLNFLFYRDISNNSFNGDIPTALMEMPMLEPANSDSIIFKLPLYMAPFLQNRTTSGSPRILNLGYDKLTGVIPRDIGQLKALLHSTWPMHFLPLWRCITSFPNSTFPTMI